MYYQPRAFTDDIGRDDQIYVILGAGSDESEMTEMAESEAASLASQRSARSKTHLIVELTRWPSEDACDKEEGASETVFSKRIPISADFEKNYCL